MASQVYGPLQDLNSSVHYNGASIGGKNNGSKALKKGGIGGRKPLDDLSNSVKQAPNQAPKKPSSGVLSFTGKELAVPKFPNSMRKKKSISGAPGTGRTGVRKALSDISNSGKPNLVKTSKKNLKEELNVLTEYSIHPDAVAEEGFLHNHKECIKAQTKEIEMDEFLKTLGLDNGSPRDSFCPGSSHPSASALSSPLVTKAKSPAKSLNSEEMSEPLLVEDPASSLKTKLSPPCKTPKPLHHGAHWTEDDCINFELVETPAMFLKHH